MFRMSADRFGDRKSGEVREPNPSKRSSDGREIETADGTAAQSLASRLADGFAFGEVGGKRVGEGVIFARQEKGVKLNRK
jgi:hypothetical protein